LSCADATVFSFLEGTAQILRTPLESGDAEKRGEGGLAKQRLFSSERGEGSSSEQTQNPSSNAPAPLACNASFMMEEPRTAAGNSDAPQF
jgi:hypothetical protein